MSAASCMFIETLLIVSSISSQLGTTSRPTVSLLEFYSMGLPFQPVKKLCLLRLFYLLCPASPASSMGLVHCIYHKSVGVVQSRLFKHYCTLLNMGGSVSFTNELFVHQDAKYSFCTGS